MLLFIVAIIAISGILYELLIGTLSSYLIGDSVAQFSLTIGLFMTGMGIWAYLSRYLQKKALTSFFWIEIILAILWGSSIILLKLGYTYLFSIELSFYSLYTILTLLIWILIGIEIPLVMHIYKLLGISREEDVSNIFTFDYIGALLASLVFPFILLPYLGVYNTGVFVWCLNLIAALLYLIEIRNSLEKNVFVWYIGSCIVTWFYLMSLLLAWERLESFFMRSYYKEPIIYHEQSSYQSIVLTKRWEDIRLFLNGNLQFLSLDEGRYHEALIDWPMKLFSSEQKLDVLVLWGGDGLAVRNLLAYKNIHTITLVDLDPRMIELAKTQKELLALNKGSFFDPRVKIVIWDAFAYAKKEPVNQFDLIVADFPDPRDVGTAKLYSKEFYIMTESLLRDSWIFITQASNAFFSKESFWSVEKTMKDVFQNTRPYHRYLPSFGDWGFVLASKKSDKLVDVNFCNNSKCDYFDADYLPAEIIQENTMEKPVIIQYYMRGYKRFNL